jgi:hypothetical protein
MGAVSTDLGLAGTGDPKSRNAGHHNRSSRGFRRCFDEANEKPLVPEDKGLYPNT